MRPATLVLLLLLGLRPLSAAVPASTADPYSLRRIQALELAQNYSPDAEKALKALLAEKPDDTAVLLRLAITIGAHGYQLSPGRERRAVMQEARGYYEQARKAGSAEPMIATALGEINPDGSENITPLAAKPEVGRILQQAEEAFGKRDFPRAKELYRATLQQDPTNYYATVYLGDAYFTTGDYAEAINWFGKAVALNPNSEKAYRYRGDALMRLNRKDDALDQYVLAVVADPYNGYSWRALDAGCQASLLKPWAPAKDLPTAQVKDGPKGPELVLPEKFTALDIAYATARAHWQEENRATRFPAGSTFRQTLDEESSALRTLIKIYGELKQAKPPAPEIEQALARFGPALDELAEIDRSGLLEAHVLFFRANADLARDYPAYREKNREKLKNYLIKYYLHLP